MFRRPKSPEQFAARHLSEQQITNNSSEVAESLAAAGLPDGQHFVTGSGALAARELPRRAGDVDVEVSPALFDDIVAAGRTPSGVELTTRGSNRRLKLPAETLGTPLDVDLIRSHYDEFETLHDIVSEPSAMGVRAIKLVHLRELIDEASHGTRDKKLVEKYDKLLIDQQLNQQ